MTSAVFIRDRYGNPILVRGTTTQTHYRTKSGGWLPKPGAAVSKTIKEDGQLRKETPDETMARATIERQTAQKRYDALLPGEVPKQTARVTSTQYEGRVQAAGMAVPLSTELQKQKFNKQKLQTVEYLTAKKQAAQAGLEIQETNYPGGVETAFYDPEGNKKYVYSTPTPKQYYTQAVFQPDKIEYVPQDKSLDYKVARVQDDIRRKYFRDVSRQAPIFISSGGGRRDLLSKAQATAGIAGAKVKQYAGYGKTLWARRGEITAKDVGRGVISYPVSYFKGTVKTGERIAYRLRSIEKKTSPTGVEYYGFSKKFEPLIKDPDVKIFAGTVAVGAGLYGLALLAPAAATAAVVGVTGIAGASIVKAGALGGIGSPGRAVGELGFLGATAVTGLIKGKGQVAAEVLVKAQKNPVDLFGREIPGSYRAGFDYGFPGRPPVESAPELFKPGFKTDKYRFELARPSGVEVLRSKPGKGMFGVRTPDGTLYTSRQIKKGFSDYTILSKSTPEGAVTTRVLKGDNVIKVFEGRASVGVPLTESRLVTKDSRVIEAPGKTMEVTRQLYEQSGFLAGAKGSKYDTSITRYTLMKQELTGRVINPTTQVILGKPFVTSGQGVKGARGLFAPSMQAVRQFSNTVFEGAKPLKATLGKLSKGKTEPSSLGLDVAQDSITFVKELRLPRQLKVSDLEQAIIIKQPARTLTAQKVTVGYNTLYQYPKKVTLPSPGLSALLKNKRGSYSLTGKIVSQESVNVVRPPEIFAPGIRVIAFPELETKVSMAPKIRAAPIVSSKTASITDVAFITRTLPTFKTISASKVSSRTTTQSISKTEQSSLSIGKVIPLMKNVPKTATKEVTKTQTKPIALTKTITKTLTRLKTRELPKLKRPITIPRITIPVPVIDTNTPNITLSKPKGLTKEQLLAYIVFIKRKGKFTPVSGRVSKEAGLDIGARITTRTLGATFKLEPVSGRPQNIKTGGEFAKYASAFRNYKIVKGQRVQLQNTYIQKRERRLMTSSEVSSIMKAKRSRPFKSRRGVRL